MMSFIAMGVSLSKVSWQQFHPLTRLIPCSNIIGTHDLCHRRGFFGHFAKNFSTPTCRVAGWLFEWILLYEQERSIPDSCDVQNVKTTEAVKLHTPEYKKSLLEQDQILKESVLELGVPTTRERLGCQVDIADRPEHHERCYPCWKQWVNLSQ